MALVKVTAHGSFANLEKFLTRSKNGDFYTALNSHAQRGTDALNNATPKDSGVTAGSWKHLITRSGKKYSISWHNTVMVGETPLVILLQYGHGTGTGGYVQGHDFINPTLKPIFDKIAADVWKEVQRR